ncbi:MAG: ribbon-helix-helix domain-containing protein [Candidatus Diapherotrites archaeon]|nr:ribbon-helix-helix domain-containing protein [Candidatus Diapherotrites archaeon]
MENVSLKLNSELARELERCMGAAHYSTKTEFIREAIREKLAKVREESAKEKAWGKLFAMRGAFKGKGKFETDEEWHNWRSNVFSKQLEKELSKKYGLKL